MAQKLPLANVVIESQRLRLVPTRESYADQVFMNFTPEITTFMFPAPPRDVGEAQDFLRRARTRMEEIGDDVQVAVLLKSDDEFIGHGGLHHIDTATPELGIWIKQSAHGHRYGMEAVTALCDWAMSNLAFEYLKYPVDGRNVASRRIPEALGGYAAAEYVETSAAGNHLDLIEYRISPTALLERRGAP